MSSRSDTFVDLALSGAVTLDDIDDFVDTWHQGGTGQELHDFLGLTWEEYALWVEQPAALRFILFARRHEEPLQDVLKQFAGPEELRGEPVAARAADREEAQAVRSWLIQTGRMRP